MANKKVLIDQYHIDITTTHKLTDLERDEIEKTFNGTIKRFDRLLWMQFPSALQKKLKVQITR